MANKLAEGSAKCTQPASKPTQPTASTQQQQRDKEQREGFPLERNKAKQSAAKAPQAPRWRIRTGAQLTFAAQAEAGIKEAQDTRTQPGGLPFSAISNRTTV